MMRRLTENPIVSVFMRTLPALLMVAVFASIAWAAGEEGGHAEEVTPVFSSAMFWWIVNFAILVIALYKFLAQPMRNFFAARKEEILSALEEAKKSKEAAEAGYRDLSSRLANREEEFAEIRKSAVENAEKLKERIIAEAHEKAQRIEEKAKESIDQEMKKAREALKQEAAELALKLSEEKLVKELTADDHRRFMKEYISGLK
jgi:F-type H+-transporting ATPase subunit b